MSVIYFSIIIQLEVWIVSHCVRLGSETMVRAVCLNMLLLNDIAAILDELWTNINLTDFPDKGLPPQIIHFPV